MAQVWNIAARKVATRTLGSIRIQSNPLTELVGVRALCTSHALGNVVKSSIPDIQLPTGNLVDTVFERASRWGSKTAIECSLTGRNYTYNQLLDGMSKWAGFLTNLGLKKGDVIAMNLTNCPEFAIVLFGSISLGVIATTINPNYTAEEIAKQLKDSEAQLLVGDPLAESAIQEGVSLYKKPLHLVMNGPSKVSGALNLQEILKDATIPHVDKVKLSGEELAVLPYSSGTTGPPKGVALTHNAFSADLRMCTHDLLNSTEDATDTFQHSYMCLLPFYHISGMLAQMLVGLMHGVKLITFPKLEPQHYIDTISKNKVEILHLVPPLLNFLIHSPLATAEKLASIRVIPIGAAPVSPSAAEAFKNKLNKNVFFQELYGMTELLVTNIVPVGAEKLGTSGKLVPNISAKIIDTSSGEMLPSSSNGEICFKTPSIMKGYYKNDEATASTIDKEGWFHTGDVGYFTDDGYLKIVDRTKELIKVKGLQVSPSELEDIIRRHPQVMDVGVVGIPDDRQGEVPRAYIVSKNQISDNDIHSFIEKRVAPHKKLAGGVVFVKELPKTNTGKILRRDLKKMALG